MRMICSHLNLLVQRCHMSFIPNQTQELMWPLQARTYLWTHWTRLKPKLTTHLVRLCTLELTLNYRWLHMPLSVSMSVVERRCRWSRPSMNKWLTNLIRRKEIWMWLNETHSTWTSQNRLCQIALSLSMSFISSTQQPREKKCTPTQLCQSTARLVNLHSIRAIMTKWVWSLESIHFMERSQ